MPVRLNFITLEFCSSTMWGVSTAVGSPFFFGGLTMGHVSNRKIRDLKRYQNGRLPLANPQQGRLDSAETPFARPVARRNSLPHAEAPKPKPTNRSWTWQWTHPYLMTATAFGVASATALLHGADLLFGWPFHRASEVYDVVALVCAFVHAIFCITVFQDLPKYAKSKS